MKKLFAAALLGATLLPLSVASLAHDGPEPLEAAPDESNVDYFWRKSDDAFHAGDYERAIGCHKAIVALDSGEIESFGVGAWLLWSLGKADEANAFILRGLEANPKNPEMWDTAGQHYDLQKRHDEAKKSYLSAVQLAGKDAPQLLRRRLAHASEKSGDWELSVNTWRALVADFPNEAVNKNNLARVEDAAKNAPKTQNTSASAAALGAGVFALIGLGVWRRKVN